MAGDRAEPAASQPPPGWYPDPSDESRQRYWDGDRWTTHTGTESPSKVVPPDDARERLGPVVTYHRASFVVTYLLGGLLLGPVAMRHAGRAEGALEAGDRPLARTHARRARRWTVAAAVVGIVTVVVVLWGLGVVPDGIGAASTPR